MKESDYQFDTLQLHAGQEPDPVTGSRAVPIYQTTSYNFRSAQHAEDLFSLKEAGNIYTRIMNPTTDVLERRLAALEGGIGALAFSSGSAAITCAIQNLAEAGDHIVAARTLYGGTHNLLAYTMPRFGIRTTLVDPSDPAHFDAAMEEKTKAVLVEAIGNPGINLCDIRAIADVAHRHGVPLIVDNTFATPYLFRPFEHGADLVVHSLTKFIGGHGTSIGGAIVDGGTFNWSADPDRFPQYNTPDPSYHGMVFARDVGEAAFITRARVLLLRDTGGCISPFNAFLILQGMETLSLRMRQHVANAQKLAEFLEGHPKVSSVSYPGLASSPYHALARQYFPRGAGAILAFECRGGLEAGRRFIDRLTLFSNLANVGDAKSLVIHPASTTHSQLSEQEQRAAGVTPGQIRVSVGIEDVSDLIRDLRQALEA